MTLIGSVFRQFVSIPSLPSTVNLKGRTVFITGANTGLGLATARKCVELSAERVILAVRTASKGEAAKLSIQKSHPSSSTKIDVWNLDLQSFESVLEIGKRAATLPRLDIAMLNAGVFPFEWTTSTNGFETGLQVNHLATALLALALLPTLKRTSRDLGQPSRLTFTSAEAHDLTKFSEQSAQNTLEAMNKKELYNGPIDRYCTSKLLNIFWVRELASRTPQNEIIVNFFNPGAVDTGIHRYANYIIRKFDRYMGRTVEQGASLVLDAAIIKGPESHGKYMSEGKIKQPSELVRSEQGVLLQKKMWGETETLLWPHVPSTSGLGDIFRI